VQGNTIQAIQDTINSAAAGDVVEVPAGTYSGEDSLVINKPIYLLGEGMSKVTLNCLLQVQGNGTGKLAIADLKVNGRVNVGGNEYETITFLSVEVHCPPQLANDDAFTLGQCKGKVLVYCCEVIGGSDGLFISSGNVHIKETEVQLARSRGIFANDYFVIEDSAVYNCGGYGIKGRAGWHEMGQNEIQPGPWGPHGPSGMMY